MAPSHIRTKKSTTRSQNHHLNCGRYLPERTLDVSSHGARAITAIEPNMASTPKNLASMMPPVTKLAICTTQTSPVKARRIA